MSASLVADETINRVVEWLFCEITKSPCLKDRLENTLHIAATEFQWYVKLGQEMFQLNSAGVEVCYGEGAATRFWDRRYTYRPAHGTKIQVVKSLQC